MSNSEANDESQLSARGAVEILEASNGLFDIILLSSEKSQNDIYQACQTAHQYMSTEGISTIVLIDRAARAIWPGIKAYSKKSGERAPTILFVDNDGFESAKYAKNIADKCAAEHPLLLRQKDKPVLVLDTCIHYGRSSKPILDGLERIGFSDVRFGVVSDHDNNTDIVPDVVLLDHRPSNACYPFGTHNLVQHDKKSLHAKPADNLARSLPAARIIRRNVATIVENEGTGFEIDTKDFDAFVTTTFNIDTMVRHRRWPEIISRVMRGALGAYWTTVGVEVVSQDHVPTLPLAVGSVALHAGFQSWRYKRSN